MITFKDRLRAVLKTLSRATGIGYTCLKPLKEEMGHKASIAASQSLQRQAAISTARIRSMNDEMDVVKAATKAQARRRASSTRAAHVNGRA